jgi:hypothetical protein
MLRLEEIRQLRKGFAAPDVPSTRSGRYRMAKSVDRHESRRGRCESDLLVWWRPYESSAESIAERLLSFLDLDVIHGRSPNVKLTKTGCGLVGNGSCALLFPVHPTPVPVPLSMSPTLSGYPRCAG